MPPLMPNSVEVEHFIKEVETTRIQKELAKPYIDSTAYLRISGNHAVDGIANQLEDRTTLVISEWGDNPEQYRYGELDLTIAYQLVKEVSGNHSKEAALNMDGIPVQLKMRLTDPATGVEQVYKIAELFDDQIDLCEMEENGDISATRITDPTDPRFADLVETIAIATKASAV